MSEFKKDYNMWVIKAYCGRLKDFYVEQRTENKKPVFNCYYTEIFRSINKSNDGQYKECKRKFYDKQEALDFVLGKYNLYIKNKAEVSETENVRYGIHFPKEVKQCRETRNAI